MIAGTIVMEDTVLHFRTVGNDTVKYTVSDSLTGASEDVVTTQENFFKALAIAVHNDGTPDHEKDYDGAEAAQPEDKDLRWIP